MFAGSVVILALLKLISPKVGRPDTVS